MKKVTVLLVAMFAVTFANAQKVSENEVPALAKSTLQKNYPNVEELKWEKEGAW